MKRLSLALMCLGGFALIAVAVMHWSRFMPRSESVEVNRAQFAAAAKGYRESCLAEFGELKAVLKKTRTVLGPSAEWSNFAPAFAQNVPQSDCLVYLMESAQGYRIWRSDVSFQRSWGPESTAIQSWLGERRDQAWNQVLVMGGERERVVTLYVWMLVPVSAHLAETQWAGLQHAVPWPLERSSRKMDKALLAVEERMRAAEKDQIELAEAYSDWGRSAAAVLLLVGLFLWFRGRRRVVRIFISYRQDGNRSLVDRMKDGLESEFGSRHVFRDEKMDKGIPNFAEFLEAQVESCDVVVWCIAPGCSVQSEGEGIDYMLHELNHAFRMGRRILPVRLTDAAPAPNEVGLPDELEVISLVNAPRLRTDPEFRGDMQALIRAIRRLRSSR